MCSAFNKFNKWLWADWHKVSSLQGVSVLSLSRSYPRIICVCAWVQVCVCMVVCVWVCLSAWDGFAHVYGLGFCQTNLWLKKLNTLSVLSVLSFSVCGSVCMAVSVSVLAVHCPRSQSGEASHLGGDLNFRRINPFLKILRSVLTLETDLWFPYVTLSPRYFTRITSVIFKMFPLYCL